MKLIQNLVKSKKTYLSLGLIILAVIGFRVAADTVPVAVTVGNAAPAFTVDVAESPASHSGSQTNEGDDVTFTATATDSSAEDYYLAICQTNAITPVNGGAPTCPGGAWAISGATASGVQASAAYTTLLSTPVGGNAWYAFVCDGNASNALCSSSSQGSGNSGSPFEVNYAPRVNVSNDPSRNPGTTFNFIISKEGSSYDLNTDQIQILVCETAGVTGTACDGGPSDTICDSGLFTFNNLSNHNCGFVIPIPTMWGSYEAYVYVFDEHGLISPSGGVGINTPYDVRAVNPSVTAVSINSGSDISLTEGTTTDVDIDITISSNNSCIDISTVETSLYRSAITYANCDDVGENNDNNCYADVSCSLVGGSCTGGDDIAADYTCTVSVEYHADPTDASTQYPTENWLATAYTFTTGGRSATGEIGTGVEMLSTLGINASGTINFGSLTVGQSNDPLDQIINVEATGNVGIDVELSGTDLNDGGINDILVTYQEYSASVSTAYGAGTDLTSSATELELNVPKTTVAASPANEDTYWGILIPTGTIPGSYSGANTFTAIRSEVGEW